MTPIKQTNAFKSFNFIQQKFVTKRKNMLKLEHHLKVIENIGYDKWLSQSQVYYTNKLIIDELCQKN